MHKQQIKRIKSEGTWDSAQLETIVHPNEYFKRSYLLKKNLQKSSEEVKEQKNQIIIESWSCTNMPIYKLKTIFFENNSIFWIQGSDTKKTFCLHYWIEVAMAFTEVFWWTTSEDTEI